MLKKQATGCFKCGKPGHWSRDCPSSATTPAQAQSQVHAEGQDGGRKIAASTSGSAPAASRKRPNLTPELLLSNDGLGYVLEHFPRLVPIRGRGHEAEDLGKLLEAYMSWHSRLLPYFPFDQFVDKVEKLGATKRIRLCLRELREKIESGEDASVEKKEEAAPFSADFLQRDASPTRPAVSDLREEVELLEQQQQQQEEEEEEDENLPCPEDIQNEFFDEFFREASA